MPRDLPNCQKEKAMGKPIAFNLQPQAFFASAYFLDTLVGLAWRTAAMNG